MEGNTRPLEADLDAGSLAQYSSITHPPLVVKGLKTSDDGDEAGTCTQHLYDSPGNNSIRGTGSMRHMYEGGRELVVCFRLIKRDLAMSAAIRCFKNRYKQVSW
jgi:hypothetical protein